MMDGCTSLVVCDQCASSEDDRASPDMPVKLEDHDHFSVDSRKLMACLQLPPQRHSHAILHLCRHMHFVIPHEIVVASELFDDWHNLGE